MRAMKQRGGATTSGFTLVEVMVTILITSMLMVAITQILDAARLTRDSIHNMQETQLAGPAILDRIEADLRGLSFFNREPAEAIRVRNRIVHGLDGDSLDFATTSNSLLWTKGKERALRSDLSEVGYRLRPNPDDNDFLEIFRRESFGVDDEPFEGGNFTFLHDRVRAFDIQVFDEDGVDAEPEEEWGGDAEFNGMPRRIEIELMLELSPRLTRERLPGVLNNQRTVTYRRIIRFPQMFFVAQRVQPLPVIPDIQPPSPDAVPGAGPDALDGGDGGDGTGGVDLGSALEGGLGGGSGGGGGTTPDFPGFGGG